MTLIARLKVTALLSAALFARGPTFSLNRHP